jgi:OFA family oxalate/formate antiporter-like MFS transporter
MSARSLAAPKGMPNRWLFVGAAVVMQAVLGNLYSWSIFRDPLMERHGWSLAQATVPFQLSIAFFALGVIVGGRWQDRVGPRRVAMVGGVILGTGFLLASVIGTSLPGLYLAYGVMGGLGIGFAYVTPIATCVKWFPDRRGAVTGLAVLGFGGGTVIGAPVGTALIEAIGVYPTFALGGLFGLTVVAVGSILRNPPEGFRPAGWEPPPAQELRHEHRPSEMVRRWQFPVLWTAYLLWAGAGLMVISQAAPLGEDLAGLERGAAAGALSAMAIFNALGRPSYGWLSDRIGRRGAAIVAQLVTITALVAVLPNAGSFWPYALGISMVGFSFGGALALMPAFTADYFGTRHLGVNYGWMFTAYGTAGILGPLLAVAVYEATGSWTSVFTILAGLSALVVVLALILRPPSPQAEERVAAVPRAA